MKHYDIVFATPGSMLHASYVRSLTETIKALEENEISWTFINYESPYIRGAREAIISDGYGYENNSLNRVPFSGHFDYNKIMWIDSDIQWEPEDVLRLYRSKRDIVTGAYRMTSGQIAVSLDGVTFPYPNQIPTSREVKVVTCGFGFLCVSKGVFEKMPRPWFDSEIVDIGGRHMSVLGEDNAWCHAANNVGYSIWLDPKVRVLHNKVMSLAWTDEN